MPLPGMMVGDIWGSPNGPPWLFDATIGEPVVVRVSGSTVYIAEGEDMPNLWVALTRRQGVPVDWSKVYRANVSWGFTVEN